MCMFRCSRCLKPAVWLMLLGTLPAAQIADGVDARVLLPAFPDIRRGVTDAQVVSRRDTFAYISRCCSVITTGWHIPD
ncbi:hypothetical protein ACLK19_22975 [Escherichia coli]